MIIARSSPWTGRNGWLFQKTGLSGSSIQILRNINVIYYKSFLPEFCNVTWLHHWWVNIGLNNDLVSSGNKPLPWPMLSKICMSLSRRQRVKIFTDSRWTDWFYLVVCMASNLIFRKQRYSGRRRRHTSIRRDSVGSLSHQRWSGVFDARYIALHWPRLGAPVSPLCFADHAVKQPVMHAPGYAAASATPEAQWHKTMLGQSHHGINSYKGRHKQRNRSKRFPIYRLRRPTRLHRIRRRHTQEFTGQGYDG